MSYQAKLGRAAELVNAELGDDFAFVIVTVEQATGRVGVIAGVAWEDVPSMLRTALDRTADHGPNGEHRRPGDA